MWLRRRLLKHGCNPTPVMILGAGFGVVNHSPGFNPEFSPLVINNPASKIPASLPAIFGTHGLGCQSHRYIWYNIRLRFKNTGDTVTPCYTKEVDLLWLTIITRHWV
jgi:hypothetical protein